ncbi:MAG: tripartite tricarboxylate transporter substrate binding protein [Pigmentiphaga sp.]|uniref:Bug family tripartite tricarboxylate transporter substrate binding protein n=1 Tax=Pigmentiphaga sp. TaxID=1977564 RepID=UPI0029A69853|nr:tripartite tricarboxylate transporter substrate binding protein [Pigmentiphaga sp.]MDX3906027.1 tripartite tricarboxylate transporter substrate binding protein [Pigmentiphaga sp.]
MNRRGFLLGGLGWAGGAMTGATHAAQRASAWPVKPVRLVVPFPGGSAPDVIVRHIGTVLTDTWKQSVIIDNRPGGSGVIGLNNLLTSPVDDHSFAFTQGSAISIVPRTIKNVPFDMERDFVPVSFSVLAPLAIAVPPDSPFRTMADLFAAARRKNESVSIADVGTYSYPHLAGEFMGLNAGVKFLHVHFQGGPPAIQATIGGHTQAVIEGMGPLYPHVQAGRLRVLGSFGGEVYPGLEGVELVSATAPGTVIDGWFATIARRGTSAPVIRAMNNALNVAMDAPVVQKAMKEQILFAHKGPPEDLVKWIEQENAKWGPVMDKLGIRPE